MGIGQKLTDEQMKSLSQPEYHCVNIYMAYNRDEVNELATPVISAWKTGRNTLKMMEETPTKLKK